MTIVYQNQDEDFDGSGAPIAVTSDVQQVSITGRAEPVVSIFVQNPADGLGYSLAWTGIAIGELRTYQLYLKPGSLVYFTAVGFKGLPGSCSFDP